MRVFVISVLKRLAVVISCCYCAGAVFAANSIWELRKEIIKEGSNEESIKYFTKDKSSRYVADFKTKGHVNVLDSNTDQLYDSSSGDGAAEKQYGGTCPVNTYDNIFYLEMMGDIYYTEFSRRLRPTKDFYLFYTFAVMYDFIKKEGKNFKDFDILVEDRWDENNFYNNYIDYSLSNTGYRLPSWLACLPAGLLSKLAAEAGADKTSKSNKDFIKMVEYVFTDIKNREGLDGKFTFEEDAPHLMKLFDYTEEAVKNAIEKHLRNYFSYNTNYMNTVVTGYNPDAMDIDKVIITRESLIFMEYFSMLYDIYKYNRYNQIQYIVTDLKNKEFNLYVSSNKQMNLTDKTSFTSKHALSSNDFRFNFNYEETIQNYSKIGAVLGLYVNWISFSTEIRNLFTSTFDSMHILDLTVGGYYKKILHNWDVHLSSGVLLGFTKLPNEHNLKDKFDYNFKNNDITLFLQGQKTFNYELPILSSIVVAVDLANTWFDFHDIVIRKKFTNYTVRNNSYYLLNLDCGVDFIKNFAANSSASIFFKNINYLNRPNNGFVLQNRTYKNFTLKTNSVIDVKNAFYMGFKFSMQAKIFDLECYYELGYDVDLGDRKRDFWNLSFFLWL